VPAEGAEEQNVVRALDDARDEERRTERDLQDRRGDGPSGRVT
jgi:hypothetical protein